MEREWVPRRTGARLLAAAVLVLAGCSPGIVQGPGTDGSPAFSPAPTSPIPVGEVPDLHPSVDGWPAGRVEVVTAEGEVHDVDVRVATTPERRAHGLMEVPNLPPGAGMWFEYEEDRTGGFWMKDTRVPLDIVFVDVSGTVVSIRTAQPCEDEPCPSYEPAGAYRNVLEVPAGWMDRVGAGEDATVRRVDE